MVDNKRRNNWENSIRYSPDRVLDNNDTDICISRVPLFLVPSRHICFCVCRMDSTYCVEYVRSDIAGNQVFGKKSNVYDRLAVTVG